MKRCGPNEPAPVAMRVGFLFSKKKMEKAGINGFAEYARYSAFLYVNINSNITSSESVVLISFP